MRKIILFAFQWFMICHFISAQKSLKDQNLEGLKFRELGPALTSGRIADFAVNPNNRSEYYVATASGGVWKTINAGTTFTPIFERQGSYSTGCIALDPNNPNVVWVGTGENNNQRSVAYGDGVYKSEDGGKTWKNVGLKTSEHIGKIIVHPDNSQVVYVASIGKLWSKGGERGLYKTTDGGKNWTRILNVSEHTGINDIVMHPKNPSILYASALQRRRHVFTWIAGGSESAIYRSTDGGKTWNKAISGLPKVDLGRIGLGISPANPEIVYAIVEAAQGKGGFFRSTNRGASWEKMSNHTTSGNYYCEIVCHPTNANIIYSMDTWMHVSKDGGKTFTKVGEKYKHVDNHVMWIDPNQPDYFLAGCDGGIYDSFDAGETWLFKPNLPITQFYKVAVDNASPFYNIYGGTQDNFSLGGPSRNTSNNGIRNSDWYVTLGGDGFESQIDPKNPNIVYSQYQYGNLFRYDKKSGEKIGIKPRERKDEPAYRWNWDAPLSVSNHKPERLYFSANKVFRSDDRGNSWQVISEDLTRQIDRNQLKVMGKVWGVDAVAKNQSTSLYGTIVAFDESPLKEDLLYVGTDDGLIQVTNDGGKNWRKIERVSGVPERTYVNQITASQHDEDVVYVAFNNHKNGDFKPYLFKSSDKGKTWKNITSNLPTKGSTYSIKEDHVDPNLLFVGTEFGIFFSNDAGSNWVQLKAGIPTIAVRDIALQKREHDLVLATFGRGFYVLDDYSVLRNLKRDILAKEAHIFPIKDALQFIESSPLGLPKKGFQGDGTYFAKNPPVGAVFTYYLKNEILSKKAVREKAEAKLRQKNQNIFYPKYEEYLAENQEEKPYLLFTIKDKDGKIIRKLKAKPQVGVNRIIWDFRYPSHRPIKLKNDGFYDPFASQDLGSFAPTGEYSVTLAKVVNGQVTNLVENQKFKTIPLNNVTLPAKNRAEMVAFQRKVSDLQRQIEGAQLEVKQGLKNIQLMRQALIQSTLPQQEMSEKLNKVEMGLKALNLKLSGDGTALKLDKNVPPSISSRVAYIVYEEWNSNSSATETQKMTLKIAESEFQPVLKSLKNLIQKDLKEIGEALDKVNAPYTPNRSLMD